MSTTAELTFIGHISSTLKELKECPKQGYEGAPSAKLHIAPAYHEAMLGMKPGSKIVVLTWFDRSVRSVLQVHPRNNMNNPLRGVFMTRSPARPNPIGLHEVEVVSIEEPGLIVVEPLEALDGTPIIDIKLSIPRR